MSSKAEVEVDGYLIVRGVFGGDTLRSISDLASTHRSGGVRNLLDIAAFRDFARSEIVRSLIEPILGKSARAVRGIFFDKTPEANWKVPWHQDLTIAVRNRVEVEGFGPWSAKAGVVHVQPPVAILDRMLALRVHLDDCGAADGPLRVIPGSHRLGRLSPKDLARTAENSSAIVCTVAKGDVILMRPLIIHASSAASAPSHRRVVHIEFSAAQLPPELSWYHDDLTPNDPPSASLS